jgi:hypothetical protein
MKRKQGLCVLAGVLGAAMNWLPLASATEFSNIVDEVSQTQYAKGHSNLFVTAGMCRGFTSGSPIRYPSYQHDPARDFIFATFTNLGLAASLQPFSFLYSGAYTYTNCNNVIGAKLGTDTNAGYYIVGGHYDSVDLNIWQYCIGPGADDNASGTAAALEAARVLSGHSFRSTLIFAGFDSEEEGLLGSSFFVNQRTTTVENHDNSLLTNIYRRSIKGMISADMIAFNSAGNPNRAEIYGGSSGSAMTTTKSNLAAAVERYGQGLTWVNMGAIWGSDHNPFSDSAAVDAVLLIDDHGSSPYYHSTEDRVGAIYNGTNYIDYPYATKMVRALVGYLAEQAGLVPTVSLSAPEPQAYESTGQPATFMVSRTDIFTNDLRVYYSVGGTATPTNDYDVLAGSVVMTNGCTNAYIFVTPVADGAAEASETVVLTLLRDANYGLGGATNATAAITDIQGTMILQR